MAAISLPNLRLGTYSVVLQKDRREATDRRSRWRGGRRASDFGTVGAFTTHQATKLAIDGVTRPDRDASPNTPHSVVENVAVIRV